MAQVIEKVVAGEDVKATQKELADALLSSSVGNVEGTLGDPANGAPSKAYIEERERLAFEQAEKNLKTNSLIFHQPGETIAVRVVDVSDEEAKQTESGSREVSPQEFAEAVTSTNVSPAPDENAGKLEEGEDEETVDKKESSNGNQFDEQ